MPVANEMVVSIHYTLTNTEGEVLDSSAGGEPLTYLHGAGNIIPGLENALVGQDTGASLKVEVSPEEGYGPLQDALIQEVPRAAFGDVEDIQEGMRFQAETDQGPVPIVVTRVTEDTVTVDGNHPLAGQTLLFDVSIEEVRAASEDELAHGHAHGPGGHQH